MKKYQVKAISRLLSGLLAVGLLTSQARAVDTEVFVGMGDSITAGYPYHFLECYARTCGGYEPTVQNLLAGEGRDAVVLNYGCPGEYTFASSDNCPWGGGVNRIDAVLAQAKPRVVLLLEGTNDFPWQAPGTVVANLRIMVQKIKAAGSIPIVSTLTPDSHFPKPIPEPVNNGIKTMAAEEGILVSDQYSAVAPNWGALNSGDGLHPNPAGYKVMGHTWFKAIPGPCDDYDSFTDVCAGYWAFHSIERLVDTGITGGCQVDPPRFCPEDHVKRSEMAAFIGRAKHGAGFFPPVTTGQVFDDVPKSYWAAPWIEQFKKDGITSGCSANPPEYCPEKIVDRAQMSVFLLKAKHGASYIPPAATGVFADAPLSEWWTPWVEQLAAEGITGGCGDGNFCPMDSVTRAEMAAFLVRTFDL